MSTATDTGTDLGWVTFLSQDHGEACGYQDCRNQATHAGIFQVFKPCTHTRRPYCLAHRDLILLDARRAHGLFWCWTCGPHATARLLRMEALR